MVLGLSPSEGCPGDKRAHTRVISVRRLGYVIPLFLFLYSCIYPSLFLFLSLCLLSISIVYLYIRVSLSLSSSLFLKLRVNASKVKTILVSLFKDNREYKILE